MKNNAFTFFKIQITNVLALVIAQAIQMKKLVLLVAFCMSAIIGLNAQEQAKPADSFVESIGIGDRFDWLNDDGKLGNAQTALSSLKIRYVRAGIAAQSGSSTYITNTKNMASALGIKLCIVTDIYNTWSTQQAWLDTWRGYAGTYAVEGPNEVGVNSSVAGIQQSIWNYAHPLGLEVYAWTLGAQAGYYRTDGVKNGGATVDDYCDYLNFHPYHWYTYDYNASKMNGLWQNGDFDKLGYGTSGCINQVRSMANNQTKPFVATEFGWCINGLEHGVSINYAKKYVIRNCFENFNAIMHRGFIFSLTSYAGGSADYSLASSSNGSLNATGQTVANTISILQEPGKSTISTTPLNYSITGISSSGGHPALLFPAGIDDHNAQNDEIHHTLLQKSNGVYYLVLWCDYDSHNGEDGWAQNATLNLPAGASSVKAYLPMNGTGVIKDYGAVATGGSVALNTANGTAIPDHILIIEITSATGIAITGVSVSPTTASVAIGATTQLTATVTPSNATNKTVTWTTSNSGIATVSTSGLVSSVAAGSANITVTTQDGAKTATSAFTVTSACGLVEKVDDVSTRITYSGTWNANTSPDRNGGTWHESNQNGAYAQLAFCGSKVELIAEKQPWGGTADVFIDGVYATGINFYNATSILQQTLYTNSSLSSTPHTIKVVNTSANWIYIDVILLNGSLKSARVVNEIADNDKFNAIEIYPNPATNYVTIDINKSMNNEVSHIQIVDLAGRKVYESSGTTASMKISTAEFLKGVYLISIRKGDEMYHSKLVIK